MSSLFAALEENGAAEGMWGGMQGRGGLKGPTGHKMSY